MCPLTPTVSQKLLNSHPLCVFVHDYKYGSLNISVFKADWLSWQQHSHLGSPPQCPSCRGERMFVRLRLLLMQLMDSNSRTSHEILGGTALSYTLLTSYLRHKRLQSACAIIKCRFNKKS